MYPGRATCIRRHVSVDIIRKISGYKLLVQDTCCRATCVHGVNARSKQRRCDNRHTMQHNVSSVRRLAVHFTVRAKFGDYFVRIFCPAEEVDSIIGYDVIPVGMRSTRQELNHSDQCWTAGRIQRWQCASFRSSQWHLLAPYTRLSNQSISQNIMKIFNVCD